MTERYAKLTLALTLSLLVAACASTRGGGQAPPPAPAAEPSDTSAPVPLAAAQKPPETKIYKGTGIFVQGQTEGGDVPPQPQPPRPVTQAPAVTLNFEGADIRDVVRNIIG